MAGQIGGPEGLPDGVSQLIQGVVVRVTLGHDSARTGCDAPEVDIEGSKFSKQRLKDRMVNVQE
jgi:hypothetical protein